MVNQSPVRNQISLNSSGIPDKLYYRIGEVARICQVPAYVLRFWETEFPHLHPNKGGSGQRLFRRRDVEIALRIKRLLYDEGYTIPGARQLLKGEGKQPEQQLSLSPEQQLSLSPDPQLLLSPDPVSGTHTDRLRQLRNQLQEVLSIVSRPVPSTAPERSRRQRSAASIEHRPEHHRSERLFEFGIAPDVRGKE